MTTTQYIIMDKPHAKSPNAKDPRETRRKEEEAWNGKITEKVTLRPRDGDGAN